MPAPATATRLLPKEHGTWAMLLVPWAVGWGVGGPATPRQILLLVAAVSLFLAHAQLLAWYRLRAAARADLWAAAAARRLLLILTALGLAAAVPLMVAMPLARLMPLVGIGALAAALTGASLGLVTRRLDHALPGQMLAAVGLPLSAPAAYYVAGGTRERVAAALWLLCGAFFLWAVFYVRLKIEARARRAPRGTVRARLSFAGGMLVIDAAILLAALAAVRLGPFSPLALAAFIPAVLQTTAGITRLDRPASLKRVGILLTAHSIVFGLAVICLA